jgi:butyryl-CoA dehydrogenase
MAAAVRSAPVSETRKRGTDAAAQYWIRTEIPRIPLLANLCRSNEDSYIRAESDWF